MKRMSVLILALLLLFSACSAEIVKDLPPEEIQPSAAEAAVEVVSGNSISVSFSPVPYARGYGYQLSDGNGYHDIASSELHFSNGLISFTISDVSQMAGDVFVYAVDGSTGNTVQIASASYTLSLENIAPDVYISERGEDFVELRTSTDNAESFFYKVNIKENGISDDDPGTDYFFFNTSEFRIEELKRNTAYTAVVSHSLDGVNYSEKTAMLSIPVYDEDKHAAIDFSISDDVLMADNIEGNSVTLYKKTNLNDSDDKAVIVKSDISVSDGSVRIESSSLSSLESGYFYFASDTAFSNVIEYTVPVTVKRITNNWKSADLEIDFASDASTAFSSLTVSGGGRNASAKYTDSGVRIENLDSNTSYPAVTLSFRPDSGLNSESVIVELETQSFAGTYEWTGDLVDGDQNTNFRIVVTDHSSGTSLYPSVPEASDAPYYVYFDSDPVTGDKSIIEQGLAGQTLRIMPLVDVKAGEPATPDGGVSCTVPGDAFAKQNAAYLANGYKWKITSYKNDPNYATTVWHISPEDYDVNALKDVVETITVSGAKLLGGGLSNLLKTTTTFSFIEADTNDDGIMEPFVKFKNVGSFFVSVGLVKNGTLRDDVEESWASEINKDYVWYLEKVSD